MSSVLIGRVDKGLPVFPGKQRNHRKGGAIGGGKRGFVEGGHTITLARGVCVCDVYKQ